MAFSSYSNSSLPLFPDHFRWLGYIAILGGLFSGYFYFWGGRPAFFEIPVFAVVTSYAETRWFVFAKTNALDEIAVVSILIGLMLVAFSKERNEDRRLDRIRIRSLFYSVYATISIWILLYLTVFGWPTIILSAGIFILFLLTYILIFKSSLIRLRRSDRYSDERFEGTSLKFP